MSLVPGNDVIRDVERFAGLVGSAEVRAASARLGAALLEPVTRLLPPGIARLIIVPDVGLHQVPFDALVVGGRLVGSRFALSTRRRSRCSAG